MVLNHKPDELIRKELEDAKSKVEFGASYSHYKHPEKRYKIKGLAVLENGDEVCVIYQAEYGGGFTFVRPLREWVETVEWQGKTLPRFKKM
jgi:hypothetical protein